MVIWPVEAPPDVSQLVLELLLSNIKKSQDNLLISQAKT